VTGCPRCLKPSSICVCDRATPLETRVRVLILQHPQEQDIALGSARLATVALSRAALRIGLSWPSLSDAAGAEVDRSRWAVVYPSSLPRPLEAAEQDESCLILDAKGRRRRPEEIEGIVVLDGTWTQAKALWWRNPWLVRLHRIVLSPKEPSIYGRLRREPKRSYLSTVESIAEALQGLGEEGEVRAQLRRLFRTMVQRARDAGVR
jgi:DTW domain-containing protein YfiP